jgi:hypothetical protein
MTAPPATRTWCRTGVTWSAILLLMFLAFNSELLLGIKLNNNEWGDQSFWQQVDDYLDDLPSSQEGSGLFFNQTNNLTLASQGIMFGILESSTKNFLEKIKTNPDQTSLHVMIDFCKVGLACHAISSGDVSSRRGKLSFDGVKITFKPSRRSTAPHFLVLSSGTLPHDMDPSNHKLRNACLERLLSKILYCELHGYEFQQVCVTLIKTKEQF